MDSAQALVRLEAARVGRLATADAGGRPHVVPVVFALDARTLYWAVDRKPKRSTAIKRIDNIRANPRAEVVVDEYREDWTALWWVRAGGPARVVDEPGERERALTLLQGKYPQYATDRPDGPVVAVELAYVRWWSGREASARSGNG